VPSTSGKIQDVMVIFTGDSKSALTKADLERQWTR